MCPLRPGTAEPSGLVPVNRQRLLSTRWLSSAQAAAWLSQRPLLWVSGNQLQSDTEPHRREEDASDPGPLRFLPCPASLLSQLSHSVSHIFFFSLSCPFPSSCSAQFLKGSRVFQGSLAKPATSPRPRHAGTPEGPALHAGQDDREGTEAQSRPGHWSPRSDHGFESGASCVFVLTLILIFLPVPGSWSGLSSACHVEPFCGVAIGAWQGCLRCQTRVSAQGTGPPAVVTS